MILHTVAAGLAFLSFASLCVFHGYLQSKGLGTYDWILRQRITPPATAQPAAAAAAAAVASVGTGNTAATRPIGGGGNSSNSNGNSNSSSSSSGVSSQPAAALPPPSTAAAGAAAAGVAAAVGGEHVAINVPSPFSLTSADPLEGYSVVDKGGREEGVMIIGPDAADTAMELGGEEGGEGGQRGWGEGEEER